MFVMREEPGERPGPPHPALPRGVALSWAGAAGTSRVLSGLFSNGAVLPSEGRSLFSAPTTAPAEGPTCWGLN